VNGLPGLLVPRSATNRRAAQITKNRQTKKISVRKPLEASIQRIIKLALWMFFRLVVPLSKLRSVLL